MGIACYGLAKFLLIFADNKAQLYVIMTTLLAFGGSIIVPSAMVGVKKLTYESGRVQGFSYFYGVMIVGVILGGPIVDLIRHGYKFTTFEYTHVNEETGVEETRYQDFSAWRTIMFFGLMLNLIMQISLCFYDSNKEKRFRDPGFDYDEIEDLTFFGIFVDLVYDFRFWRFLLFSFVLVGPKLVFSMLFFMLPKIVMQDYGEDQPFGIYVSIAPILIIIFLLILSPLQANYDPYDIILLGSCIATLGPIPMFFGMNIVDFIFFIIIISFAEALYAPVVNVFTFNFTKEGREGTFVTLTDVPTYFTMAVTGVTGGYMLENYYPVTEDEDHQKKPWVIWLILLLVSALSTLILFLGRPYFECYEDEDLDMSTKRSRSARS